MSPKKILVLGSGSVAKPCVDYLLRDLNNHLTIACRTLVSAKVLSRNQPRTTPISLDVTSSDLDRVIADHEVVVSLVPFIYHPTVVRSAIKGKTNVVTASYVSPEIRALENFAVEAGITIVNEVGVDPGVDHLYAVKTIGEVHEKGGKKLMTSIQIKEFYSYCGGLPALEAANNPLRFKFSWSPRGALLSQCNSATFLQEGREVTISSKNLMASAQPYYVMDGYSFVAYPNRNSLPFREFYNIPEAQTIIRGSLRYKGNPELVKALFSLGWLNPEERSWLGSESTWAQLQQRTTGAVSASEVDLISRVDELCSFSDLEERSAVLEGLRWIGLFSEENAPVKNNLLDTLSSRLESLCSFRPGERDLVMLQHKFVVEWQDGKIDPITSTMELLGDPEGDHAMSKSVGITCGIATQLLLDGHPAIAKPGIVAPYTKELCDALRAKVEAENITLIEKVL
ncbi:saccharopine dehydrogenase [Colletotrichum truncatum]|uniref:Saccharopine dehydrogenase n=1 Tax=Colletotrichum truncatum TaxID=5467 RepID=A0ACC3YNU8_COLTU|nr:saccharopine dehydrogenase [Colletotrichum truncatum]KAF6781150.1 saccharopine dehydrogenase [Colletotrichum truncatum]